jgi:hypothetical protein
MCRIVRAWSAVTGDPARDDHGHGFTSRHIATCPCCRAYFSATTDLESRLRRAAPRESRPLPEGFERRLDRAIADAIREQRPTTSAGGSRLGLVLWGSLAGAAAAVAMAFLLLRSPDGGPSEGPPIAEIDPARALDESVAVARTLNNRFWNDVAPTASTLVQENPLQQEIGAVYSEAQSALQFLAMNFLPASATRTTPAEEAGTSRSG